MNTFMLCCAIAGAGILLSPHFGGILLKLKLTEACPKGHLWKFGLYGAGLGAISAVILNATVLELLLHVVNGATFSAIFRASMLASKQLAFNHLAWQQAGKAVNPITHARWRGTAKKLLAKAESTLTASSTSDCHMIKGPLEALCFGEFPLSSAMCCRLVVRYNLIVDAFDT